MSGIAVRFEISDAATPLLQRLAQAMHPKEIGQRVAPHLQALFQDHLRALNARSGRSNFYAHAAEHTTAFGSDAGIIVRIIAQGIAQRYFGGRIDPVVGKALAIPVAEEAMGTSPVQWGLAEKRGDVGLHFIPFRNAGKPNVIGGLVENLATYFHITPKRQQVKQDESTIGKLMFVLVSYVDQKTDPSVLPSNDVVRQTVIMALEGMLARIKDNGAGGVS